LAFSASTLIVAVLSRKLMARLGRRLVTKFGGQIFKRFAAARGGSLIGGLCGPFAAACITALTALLEFVAIKLDELITRDSFRKELKAMILQDLETIKQHTKQTIAQPRD